jgi:uncharacterized protein YbaR (Trm112 family)
MPVSSELVEILVCPESKQPVAIASQDVLARVNDKISAGSLRNRGGEKVEKAITEGLLRDAGKILYAVDDGIPVMLIEESIEID